MPENGFTVDPDIRRAATLPSALYHDPEWYRLQQERIFARSWQWVGTRAQLRTPGRTVPFTLLDGCLDEPLVLTHDDDGVLHCLSNVCTHRGALVVEGAGHQRSLRCRYHGRRFTLGGRCTFMPEFENVEGFPSAADDLPELPLGELGPFLFSGIDPMMPFADWIEPLRPRIEWMPFDEFVEDPSSARDYLIRAHWALYVDNYLEEFHIPFVHASLAETIDYATYATETYAWASLQLALANEGEHAFELPAGHPDHGRRVAAFYYWLFPNLMLNFYPWGISLNLVTPLGPDRTRVSFRSWVWDASKREQGAGAGLHRVEMEDEEVVESVQRGVRSRLYDRGRYSARREIGTHHFHTLLARTLQQAQGT
ncbi:MAG TPA: aromatic ring-hydroxylating dioxygenase subunit alpha [Longimicrobiales bacterium]|nr:aromatic ring-hydroxylating dioxygenase subunit alpha [Longimicrobiales bacterium]